MILEAELKIMYHDKKMTQTDIAEVVGVSRMTIIRWMKEYNIAPRTHSERQLGDLVKPSKEDLAEMYWSDGMSTYKIGELCGVSRPAIQKWMRDYEIETRTMSEAATGEKNSNWKNGISSEPYCYKFNNRFREAVRERDGYTCQLCGFKQNGRRLSVHHIHYKKSDCYPDVVTLCDSCNTKVNSNRDYWEEHFENQLIERGLIYWSLST